jgi:hypothetical protein
MPDYPTKYRAYKEDVWDESVHLSPVYGAGRFYPQPIMSGNCTPSCPELELGRREGEKTNKVLKSFDIISNSH